MFGTDQHVVITRLRKVTRVGEEGGGQMTVSGAGRRDDKRGSCSDERERSGRALENESPIRQTRPTKVEAYRIASHTQAFARIDSPANRHDVDILTVSNAVEGEEQTQSSVARPQVGAALGRR